MQLRICALAGALAVLTTAPAASAAFVGSFQIQTVGTTTVDFDTGLFTTMSIVTSQTGGLSFDELDLSGLGDVTLDPIPADGTFTFSGPDGSLTALFDGFVILDDESGTSAGAAQFTIIGGTGEFDGKTGSGTFSSSTDPFSFPIGSMIGTAETLATFRGMLVPAPASLLGFALIGMMPRSRRRRRTQ